MSLKVGELYGKISIDDSALKTGLASANRRMDAAGKDMSRTMGGHMNKMSGLWKGALAGGAAAMGAAALGLGVVIKKGLEASSEQEQAFGALDSVFKKNAESIKLWAAEQEKLGLSNAEAANTAVLMGGKFKSVGYSMKESGERAKELTQLGADLAATYGGTTADAVAALSSTFNGEYDPLERYNAKLSASAVSAKAVSMGLAKTTASVDDAARVQATYALILEKTVDAQGQATREADTYAGQLGTLKANWQDTLAAVGDGFRPAAAKIMKSVNRFLPEFEKQIRSVSPMIEDWASDGADSLTKMFEKVDLKKSMGGVNKFFSQNGPMLADTFQNLGQALKAMLPVLQASGRAFNAMPEQLQTMVMMLGIAGGAWRVLGGPIRGVNTLLGRMPGRGVAAAAAVTEVGTAASRGAQRGTRGFRSMNRAMSSGVGQAALLAGALGSVSAAINNIQNSDKLNELADAYKLEGGEDLMNRISINSQGFIDGLGLGTDLLGDERAHAKRMKQLDPQRVTDEFKQTWGMSATGVENFRAGHNGRLPNARERYQSFEAQKRAGLVSGDMIFNGVTIKADSPREYARAVQRIKRKKSLGGR